MLEECLMWNRVIIIGNNLRDHGREGIIKNKENQGTDTLLPEAMATRQSLSRESGEVLAFCFWLGRVPGFDRLTPHAVQVRTGQFRTVDTSPVRTWNINKGKWALTALESPPAVRGTAAGGSRERRCTMNPNLIIALTFLMLVLIPLLFTLFLIVVQAVIVLALSQSNEERKAALVSVLVGALKRR
ncbi:hypothetical protein ANT_21270 [Anaerolinea thermophila UNI-1]|uniref:Uncharacterized protein n=2 Tax=Anaerolinea thermophila TaxID=167964 RepID=E8MXS2_ANATU|nr:hypothetical protein ANT_21270 [Anaerolinea thermophila UNI-1]